MLSHGIGILSEPLLLLFRVDGIVAGFAGSTQVLRGRDAVVDPRRSPDEICHRGPWQFGHLRYDLDPGRAVPDDGDTLVRVVKLVVPVGRVDAMVLEVFETLDVGPLVGARMVVRC